MKVIKNGNVEILNYIECPFCGAIYNDVKPADLHWVDDNMLSYYAITCQFCGREIEVRI